ncbi:MAG: pentapeptide repeat-containing protein [Coleofasciculaceae cyanobacterium]
MKEESLAFSDGSVKDLIRADLRGADLRGADLSSAELRGADFSRADLSEVIWSEETKWENSLGFETAVNVPDSLKQKLGLD